MLKYLLLAALLLIVWWAWRKRKAPDRSAPPPEKLPESMVRCAHCGVHLPESDAIAADGRHFCNAAHRRAAGEDGD